MKFSWYYRWHLSPWAQKVHLSFLVLWLIGIGAFAYLNFALQVGRPMAASTTLTLGAVINPAGATSSKVAYAVTSGSPGVTDGSEVATADYQSMGSSDDVRYASGTPPQAPGAMATQIFRFYINPASVNKTTITQLSFTHEGYGARSGGNGRTMKIWDFGTSAWVQLVAETTNAADADLVGSQATDSGTISNYVDSNNYVYFVVVAPASTGVWISALYTDYAKLDITTSVNPPAAPVITAPNGGESWPLNTTQNVTWSTAGSGLAYQVEASNLTQYDNFNDNSIDGTKWIGGGLSSGITTEEAGGELKISGTSTSNILSWFGLTSTSAASASVQAWQTKFKVGSSTFLPSVNQFYYIQVWPASDNEKRLKIEFNSNGWYYSYTPDGSNWYSSAYSTIGNEASEYKTIKLVYNSVAGVAYGYVYDADGTEHYLGQPVGGPKWSYPAGTNMQIQLMGGTYNTSGQLDARYNDFMSYTVNPAVSENFDSYANGSSINGQNGWVALGEPTYGSAQVANGIGNYISSPNSVALQHSITTGTLQANKPISPSLSGVVIAEADMKISRTDKEGTFRLDSGGAIKARAYFQNDGRIYGTNGATNVNLQSYTAGTWYHFKFVLDTKRQKYDVYINGVLKGSNYDVFDASGTTAIDDVLFFSTSGGTTCTWNIDNVQVYTEFRSIDALTVADATSTTWNTAGWTAGTNYLVRNRAYNSTDNVFGPYGYSGSTFTLYSVPGTPAISSPSNNETGVSVNPPISSSNFSGTGQTSADWEIYDNSDLAANHRVWYKMADAVNLTSTTVNASAGAFANSLAGQIALAGSTDYWVHVRHNNAAGSSTWSAIIKFTTLAVSNCIWNNAGGTGLWNTPANWSCGHVPANTDGAILDGSVSNANLNINVSATAGSFTVKGTDLPVPGDVAYSGTITQNADLNIDNSAGQTGDYFQGSGTFNANNFTITITGNWDSSVGTFNYNTSNVNITDTGTIKTKSDSSWPSNFYNLTVSAASETTDLQSKVGISNVLTLGTGNLTSCADYCFPILNKNGGTPLSNAGANISTARIVYHPTSGTDAVAAGNYGSAIIELFNAGAGGSASFLQSGDITTSNTFWVVAHTSTGSFNFGTQNHMITSGAFKIGDAVQTGVIPITLGSSTLNIGSGGIYVQDPGVATTHALDLGSSTINNAGPWTMSSGNSNVTVTPGTSTVNFTATTTGQTITSNGQSFNNLVFSGTGGGWTLQDDLTATNITITAGNLNDNGKTVTINGNISITGNNNLLTSTGTWVQAADGNINNSDLLSSNSNQINIYTINDNITVTQTGNYSTAVKIIFGSNSRMTGANSNFHFVLYATDNDPLDLPASSDIAPNCLEIVFPHGSNFSQKAFTMTGGFEISYTYSTTVKMTGNWTASNFRFAGSVAAVSEATAMILDTDGYNLTTAGNLDLGLSLAGFPNAYQVKVLFKSGAHTIGGNISVKQDSPYTYAYIDLGSSNISVGGNIDFRYGTVTPGTSTVTMTATSTGKTITSAGQSFKNIVFNGTGGGWTLQDNLNVISDISVTVGNLTTNSKTVNIGGNMNIAGTLTAGTSAINCTGNINISGILSPGSSTITGYGNWDSTNGTLNPNTTSYVHLAGANYTIKVGCHSATRFDNLQIADVGSTATLLSNLCLTTQLTVGSGTPGTQGVLTGSDYFVRFDHQAKSIVINNTPNLSVKYFFFNGAGSNVPVTGGNYGNSGVQIGHNGSSSTFNINGNITTSNYFRVYANTSQNVDKDTIYTNGYSVNASSIRVGGNSDYVDLIATTSSFTTSGDLTINPGSSLSLTSGTINLAGSWIQSGTFTSGTSTINFTGASSNTITTNGSTFNNIFFNGSGSWQLQDDLSMNGNLTINAGTFDANGQNISLKGDWSNSSVFTPGATPGNQTVNLTGSDNITQNISGNTSFNIFSSDTSSNSSGRTISFAAGSTQNFNIFNIIGHTGKIITLQSSASNNWSLVSTSTSVSYSNIANSTNTGSPICASFSQDSGYNTGWNISSSDICSTKLLIALPGQNFSSGVGVTGQATNVMAGNSLLVNIYAVDNNNRIDSGSTRLVDITSSDSQSSIPSASHLVSGSSAITIVLKTSGLASITATASSMTPGTQSIDVIPSHTSSSHSVISADPVSLTVGNSSTITTILKDEFDNVISDHQTSVSSSNNDDGITYYNQNTDTNGQAKSYVKSATAHSSTLTVRDETENLVLTSSLSITFVDLPLEDRESPVAKFNAPARVIVGSEVLFDATGSTDDYMILSYSWDFGDSTKDSLIQSTKGYAKTGRYQVTLVVADSAGHTATITQPILVIPPAPIISNIARIDTALDVKGSSIPNGVISLNIDTGSIVITSQSDAVGIWGAKYSDLSKINKGAHIAVATVTDENNITSDPSKETVFVITPPEPVSSPGIILPVPIQQIVNSIQRATGRVEAAVQDITPPAIKETVQAAKTPVAVTAVTVGVAQAAIGLNIFNFLWSIYSAFLSLLQFLGIRQRREPWGVVYNSVTKKPINLAAARIFEKTSGRLLETSVTDNYGRFGFLVEPGEYYIKILKDGYAWASKIVPQTVKNDDIYENIYHGEAFVLKSKNDIINYSTPADPISKEKTTRNTIRNIRIWIKKYYLVFLVFSLVLVIFSKLLFKNDYDNLSLCLLGCLLLKEVIEKRKKFNWGVVYDSITKKPIEGAQLDLLDERETVKDRVLTDKYGRFGFLASPGTYTIIAEKNNYSFPSQSIKNKNDGTYTDVYHGEKLHKDLESSFVAVNIPMDQGKSQSRSEPHSSQKKQQKDGSSNNFPANFSENAIDQNFNKSVPGQSSDKNEYSIFE